MLKVLELFLVMVLLRHSSDCGCSLVVSLCCYQGHLLSCTFPAVNTRGGVTRRVVAGKVTKRPG